MGGITPATAKIMMQVVTVVLQMQGTYKVNATKDPTKETNKAAEKKKPDAKKGEETEEKDATDYCRFIAVAVETVSTVKQQIDQQNITI